MSLLIVNGLSKEIIFMWQEQLIDFCLNIELMEKLVRLWSFFQVAVQEIMISTYLKRPKMVRLI